ncbi:UNVERIFIED_CONTAM: Retrovirus-related Pol polyprotein from transposon RE1 [Sesamum calycinum]|uniref:Retrovirus-related Pol polyprotein from transposon RE1 n=1 Tax=Sesamum calycinum TaxID=2727403 RepID=A0AAW2KF93_9LAMI
MDSSWNTAVERGYALENATKVLNMARSKKISQTPYEIWHSKPTSYKYLKVWGSPANVNGLVGDKLDSRSSLCRFIRYPKETTGLCDEIYPKESSEVFHETSETASAPIVPTDSIPVLHRSARVNQPPERYGLVGLTSQLDNDPKTPSSWQKIDVKTTFLNGFIVEEIYMDQSEGFTSFGEEQKEYNFIKNESDPCVYKTISESSVLYLTLYMDDILLIGNDVKMLGDTNAWLSTQFSMKDIGETSYILGIKIYQDRSRRMLGMTQSSYI